MAARGRSVPALVLAGDVGGTKTLLGVFQDMEGRPRKLTAFSYPTTAFTAFTEILAAFLRDADPPSAPDAVAIGVAGPVVGNRANLTNVNWGVDGDAIASMVGNRPTRLLNDLEAMATAVEALEPEDVVVLQEGVARHDGHAVVIAAGTGLGEAYLHRVDGRLRPLPSEGGHADFAPRTDRELQLLQMLRAEYGRAEVEHVLSGPGLLNLHRFTHAGERCPAIAGLDAEQQAPAISEAALAGRCASCVEALAIFVSVYGAEAGNLALRGVATSGVYIGGGIAPKILPALGDGRFLEAFRAKGTMSDLVAQMPVKVILNEEAGLIGAAVHALSLVPRRT